MDPLSLILGFATFYGLKEMKQPLRKASVKTTSQLFNLLDHSREMVYTMREELEDIVAEAHYENLKRNQQQIKNSLQTQVKVEKGGENND